MFQDTGSDVAVAPVQSVARAGAILDLLARCELAGQTASLAEVAALLGVPTNTAHNLIKSLIATGYAAKDEQRGYALGPKWRDATRGARLAGGLAEAAGLVHQLAAETGESAVLATLLDGHRQVLCRAEGSAVVRVSADLAEAEQFWEVVTGRVLAAHSTGSELARIVAAQGLPGGRWLGLDQADRLAVALAELRDVGLAEAVTGGGQVTALAAPVLDRGGRLLAALGLFLPTFRVTEARLTELRTALLAGAERLAGAL